MGKRGKHKKRYHETGLARKSDQLLHYEHETPDPESFSYYHDEVDEFHLSRQKAALDRTKRISRQEFIDDGNEEVFPVRVESDEEDSEGEDMEEEEGDVGGDESDMDSDICDKKTEEDYLPSADAWGKKKRTYYDTDYVDEDYGGFSGSDAEAAEMEEQEALRLQKKMAEHLREEDFFMDDLQDFSVAGTSKEQKEELDLGTEKSSTSLEGLSFEQKVQLVKERCPEISSLTEEYNNKREILVERLEPVFEAVKNGKISIVNTGLRLISMKYQIYNKYAQSKKGLHSSVQNHPVLDRIMEWKRMAKNKGLTPHRKKEQRNPRVKHKNKYRKALIRKRGQIPDFKRELSRYGGESRGIKIGLVKSVKLG